MGRSKFPGKPSKHVNKQRVNVLSCSTNSSDSKSSITENIFIQLPSGIGPSLTHTKQYLTTDESSRNSAELDKETGDNKRTERNVTNSRMSRRFDGRVKFSKTTREEGSELRLGTGDKSITSNDRKLGRFKNREKRNSSSLAGKFVLPKRSVHSSRVIKPNKRFVDGELKCPPVRRSRGRPPGESSDERRRSTVSKLDTAGENSDLNATPVDSRSPSPQLPNKLVLREAKLRLRPVGGGNLGNGSASHDGPFTSCVTIQQGHAVPPGTVTCGVCGAVRFYRFVKQARKFNIYSCESCRKFISKMMKRRACHRSGTAAKLVCHGGRGVCHVPPIVRSQQWKLIRCAYKARCPACWLKMCLRSFKMPSSLEASLAEMLPDNMRGVDNIPLDLGRSDVTDFSTDGTERHDARPCASKFGGSFGFMKMATRPSSKFSDVRTADVQIECPERRRRGMRAREKLSRTTDCVSSPVGDRTIRQKLDLRGPRVKHVCRSASIVLGQPVATFRSSGVGSNACEEPGDRIQILTDTQSSNELSEDVMKQSGHSSESTLTDCSRNQTGNMFERNDNSDSVRRHDENVNELCRNRKYDGTGEMVVNVVDNSRSEEKSCDSYRRRNVGPVTGNSRRFTETKSLIYDSAEIREHGFGLVISKDITLGPLCYLCGSAGQSQLIHCSLCCEPYHPFCVGIGAEIFEKEWMCLRCTATCAACSVPASSTIACVSCKKMFHTRCLVSENCLVCFTCNHCSECGTTEVNEIVGRSLFCSDCFNIKYKSETCHQCEKGFISNVDSKVIECSECKNLCHISCENISEEQFLMLRTMPVYTRFHCHKCSSSDKHCRPPWQLEIESRLVAGCLSVLRSLVERRVSPKKREIHSPPVNLETVARKEIKPNERNKILNELIESTSRKRTDSASSCDNVSSVSEKKCSCTEVLTLLEVKRKIVSKDYNSLMQFRHDLDLAIRGSGWNELLGLLDDIIQKAFPWFKRVDHEDIFCERNDISDTEKLFNSSDASISKWSVLNKKNNETSLKTDIGDSTSVDREYSDARICILCATIGDAIGTKGGRLLFCEADTWVHVACALWSVGIHETLDGALLGVAATVCRARHVTCRTCGLPGATVDCSANACCSTYHFPCAVSAGCRFSGNYRVRCAEHPALNDERELDPEEFDVTRPVYVHVDTKRRITNGRTKLQFVVGSLVVGTFGTYVPVVSDYGDVIVPTGMRCTRLFWSTIEPWRIVGYTITSSTVFPRNTVERTEYERNVTVDHLDDIDKKIDNVKRRYYEDNLSDVDGIIKSRDNASNSVETSCPREIYESEEEPQNGTDILPPEIKDAIFEDLPHDVLDGISMQDIFPKLMSYDDPLSADSRNDSCFRDDVIPISDQDRSSDLKRIDAVRLERKEIVSERDIIIDRGLKRSKSEVLGFSALVPLHDFTGKDRGHRRSCSLAWSCKFSSGNLGMIKKRKISCITPATENFTISADNCKDVLTDAVDCSGSESRLEMENRCLADVAKMKENLSALRRKFLQVDGINDLSSSDDEELETTYATTDVDIRYSQKYDEEGDVDAPVKCQRCQCTYRTPDSYSRHLNNCETLSTSESDSETLVDAENYSTVTDAVISTSTSVAEINEKSPEVVSHEYTFVNSQQICYQNKELVFSADQSGPIGITNSIISDHDNSASNSISYTNPSPLDTRLNLNPLLPSPVIVPHRPAVLPLSDAGEGKLIDTSDSIIRSDRFSIDSNVGNLVPVILDPTNVGNNICDNRDSMSSLIIRSNNISSDVPKMIDTSKFVIRSDQITNPAPKINEISSLIVRPKQIETESPTFVISNSSVPVDGLFVQKDGLSTTQPIYGSLPQMTQQKVIVQMKQKPEPAVRSATRNRGRPITSRRPLLSKQIRTVEKQSFVEMPNQARPANITCTPTTFVIQPQPVPKQQTYIVQSLGGLPNGLPTTYHTPDTLHHGLTTPGVQYLIAPNNMDCGTLINNQFVTSSPIIPTATFQIHSGLEPSVNLIGIPTNTDVGLMPTITSPLVGTIVRSQPITGAIECGLVSTEQLMLNATPTIQPAPQTCVYLGGQPVYYGLETVVQNTVMSTQQFMSTVLPGQVLAQNSSFSATTQVFQTSTIHEQPTTVLDVQDTRNCVLLAPQTQRAQNFARPDTLTGICTPHTPFPSVEQHAADVTANYTVRPIHQPPQQQRMQQVRMTPVSQFDSERLDELTFVMEPLSVPVEATHTPSVNRPAPFIRKSITCTPSALVQPHTTHITLPIAPNQPQGIPTNVVPPTPHVKSPTQRVLQKPLQRPMNRVLPMTASPVREEKEDILQKAMKFMQKSSCPIFRDDLIEEKPTSENIVEQNTVYQPKNTEDTEKNIVPAIENITEKNLSYESSNRVCSDVTEKPIEVCKDQQENVYISNLKATKRRVDFETAPLKFVFRKQTEEGVYEITDKKLSEAPTNKPVDRVVGGINRTCSLSMPSLDDLEKSNKNVGTRDTKTNIKTHVSFVNGHRNGTIAPEIQKKAHRARPDLSKKQIKNHVRDTNVTKEKKSRILFRVQSQDGFTYTSASLSEIWQKVLSSVQASRLAHNLPPLPSNALNEFQILGLKNPSLKCILEEMRRVRLAEAKGDEKDLVGESSPGGAARCTPFSGHRSKHDVFSWLASRHRKLEFARVIESDNTTRLSNPRASSINLPVVTRYRNLKETSKKSVGVYRSNIHGRGLFCLRDIELGEMVIEYAGEVIRSSMTDLREKYYNSKGIGCYMFRIDDNLVVDATVKGNAARFINHSCDPNCYSRVLEILGHKHILIFALRRILQGEELTYDYKFPFEEDKIPCTCGARRCRKYLN